MPPSTSKSISRSQGISRTSCSSFPAPLLAHLRLPLLLLLLTVFLAQQPGGGPSSVAMALPVSMLNSLSNFYPLSALLRGREEPPRLALVVVKGAGREASSDSRMLTPVQPVELAASSRREPLLSNIAAISSQTVRPTKPQKFGTLKLCPPGGRSFFEAFELACPMRKRRKRHVMLGSRISVEPPRMRKFHLSSESQQQPEEPQPRPSAEEETYRPANISEIMRICCVSGCEFADFFAHCGPFSMW